MVELLLLLLVLLIRRNFMVGRNPKILPGLRNAEGTDGKKRERERKRERESSR